MRSRRGRILGNRKRRQESAAERKANGVKGTNRSPGEPEGTRSPEEQLKRLDALGWRAEKERAKLKAMIANRKAVA